MLPLVKGPWVLELDAARFPEGGVPAEFAELEDVNSRAPTATNKGSVATAVTRVRAGVVRITSRNDACAMPFFVPAAAASEP